ncbi:hydroxymethylglutaryl-CoA reductase [Saccharicrinis sp. FJH62]|uniref:hydroxymethylglutaryl-CoA reductase n=1 Tax=Saccharicrinis sp. FJH62 TaxID=3344657 RepID=UPI0035D47749
MFKGFSRLSKDEKRQILIREGLISENELTELIKAEHSQVEFRKRLEGFSENVLSSYHLPFSVAPNFLINGSLFMVPMVTEESSVVAAAAAAAGFWAQHGGFHCVVKNTVKVGQVFFEWEGEPDQLHKVLSELTAVLNEAAKPITENMEKRGGGITGYSLVHHVAVSEACFELHVEFETADSMGANFINSCLEIMATEIPEFIGQHFPDQPEAEIIMAILSNHTPECTVECYVEAPFEALGKFDTNGDGKHFAVRFKKAVDIALNDTSRAVTHNKGIYNGISAVLLATGNDFRAVEAAGHAFAVKNGKYVSLSGVTLTDNSFRLSLEVPLAVGTVGGLTRLHPLAASALKMLKEPDAKTLMMVIAAAGLASNFSAVKALTTSGIQHGHMKMHLVNILNQMGATSEQVEEAQRFFKDKTVSVSAVRSFLTKNN